MEESLANGALDRLFRPIRMLRPKSGRLELPRGMVEAFGGFQFLGRRKGPLGLRSCLAHVAFR